MPRVTPETHFEEIAKELDERVVRPDCSDHHTGRVVAV
jgi:hypothetical protein